MVLKFILLILPLLIFIVLRHINNNLKQNGKSEKVIKCEACNTFVHESLMIKRYQKNYCSKECSSL